MQFFGLLLDFNLLKESAMEINKLFDLLDGLFAYDTGCVNSGINDVVLKNEVKCYLGTLDEVEFRVLISTFVRDKYLTEQALSQGYGIEEVICFVKWLNDYMDIHF